MQTQPGVGLSLTRNYGGLSSQGGGYRLSVPRTSRRQRSQRRRLVVGEVNLLLIVGADVPGMSMRLLVDVHEVRGPPGVHGTGDGSGTSDQAHLK